MSRSGWLRLGASPVRPTIGQVVGVGAGIALLMLATSYDLPGELRIDLLMSGIGNTSTAPTETPARPQPLKVVPIASPRAPMQQRLPATLANEWRYCGKPEPCSTIALIDGENYSVTLYPT